MTRKQRMVIGVLSIWGLVNTALITLTTWATGPVGLHFNIVMALIITTLVPFVAWVVWRIICWMMRNPQQRYR